MQEKCECSVCGKEIYFYRRKSENFRDRKYCSKKCESIARKNQQIGKYNKKRISAVQLGKFNSKLEHFKKLFEDLDKNEVLQKTISFNYLRLDSQYEKMFNLSLSQIRTYFKFKNLFFSERRFPECFTKIDGNSFEWYKHLAENCKNYFEFKIKFNNEYENHGISQRAVLKSILKKFCELEHIDFEKFIFDKRTLPEEIIRDFLIKKNIQFEEQRHFLRGEFYKRKDGTFMEKFWKPDFYIKNGNKIIEVNGDYWHSFGIPFEKMNEFQKNRYINDQKKYLWYKQNEFKFIIIWEHDILKNNFKQLEEFLND